MEQEANLESIWRFIVSRNITVVQNKDELGHILSIAKNCSSYLEIGTAEGNSLYAVSRVLQEPKKICSVDLGERHTIPLKNEIVSILKKDGIQIKQINGNSHDAETVESVRDRYDLVFIDAGHSYYDAEMDARIYGAMADKYIIFHDLCIPEVKQAFDEYKEGKKSYEFGTEYILGVIEL